MISTDIKKIAIHGVPRSGTSWIGEIVNSSPNTIYKYQPLFSYAHKDYLTNSSTKEDIDSFFYNLIHCDDSFTNQKKRRNSGDFPMFSKQKITHVVYKEVRYMNILFNMIRRSKEVLLCGIIRNPLSVISSWINAPREFRKDLGWLELEEWRYAFKKNLNRPEEFYGYEKWKEAANIFLNLKKIYPNQIYILNYSDMLFKPIEETERLFNFLGLKITGQTFNFIDESMKCSNKNDPYAVFRNKKNDNYWNNKLHSEIILQIQNDLIGTHLEIFI